MIAFLEWLFILSLQVSISSVIGGNGIPKPSLESFANSIGTQLSNFANKATKFEVLKGRFESGNYSVEPINLQGLFNEIVPEINKTLTDRIKALEKTVNDVEQQALNHYRKLSSELSPQTWEPRSYFNSKKLLNEGKATNAELEKIADEKWPYPVLLKLTRDDHFQADVNLTYSSVHVPTSIFAEEEDMLEALTWSSDLDARFRSNYAENPTLGFQYFGSSTGFLRHYPAMKWSKGLSPAEPDLYDCRVRPWYTAAAASPKNILILLDVSGSMTGLRSEISEHVVLTILETLTNNDFVNVFNFSEFTEPLVPCFNNTLVQANLENIREFKVALGQASTKNLANYTRAFEKAFTVLDHVFDGENSSRCNQAIMMITDGAPEYFKEIFDEWNKDKEIRLFTFLIGKEVTDWKEVLWMACYNKGFFAHVETIGEVQEQVVKYLPVMSRPLVLNHARQVSYTPVYADNSEIVESEWQWEEKIKTEQKKRSERYKWFLNNVHKKGSNLSLALEYYADPGRETPKTYSEDRIRNFIEYGRSNISEKMKRRVKAEAERIHLMRRLDNKVNGPRVSPITSKQLEMKAKHAKAEQHRWGPYEKQFRFVISSSFPVLDLRSIHYDPVTNKEERIAHFLGVVGTDTGINELVKLSSPFKLGVNSYAFMITNNGYIVFHPDWRPTHDGILKPNYNTVDMFEVELVNKDNIFRNNDEYLLRMRRAMIDSTMNSSRMEMEVRVHRDGFARVHIRKQEYVYGRLPRTPYTLVLVAPIGTNRFVAEIELMRHARDKKINVISYFDLVVPRPSRGYIRRWGLNPDWSYCEFLGSGTPHINNKEDSLLYFLQKIYEKSATSSNSPWKNTGVKGDDQELYQCDKSLVQSVIYDAEVTSIFKKEFNDGFGQVKRGLMDAFRLAFVATRSGLTRWVEFGHDDTSGTDIRFTKQFPRATEEIWYKRAVEWNEIDESAFVFSLPFDAGTRNASPIIGTRALFVEKGHGDRMLKAPVAVVGVQFNHEELFNLFMWSGDTRHFNYCQGPQFDCFLLDDSGFIIYSAIRDDNGRFMGDVDPFVMEVLLSAGIYTSVNITDFQGICKQSVNPTSFANVLSTPLKHFQLLLKWFVGRLAWLILQFNLHSFINPDYGRTLAEFSDGGDRGGGDMDETMSYIAVATYPKTKLRPCDMQYRLYTYGPWYKSKLNSNYRNHKALEICDDVCNDYINVQRIPHTNLIFVIVEAKCRCESDWLPQISIKGEEIKYEMYAGFENLTQDNPVLLELCLTPQPPLYRRFPQQCHSSHPDEALLRRDCGGGATISAKLYLILVMNFVWTLRYWIL